MVALYSEFLEGDLWEARLQEAAPEIKLEEFDKIEDLLQQIKDYQAAIVAVDGPQGLAAVRAIRGNHPNLPLLWIADEEDFTLFAYRYHVNAFLLNTASAEKLQNAMQRLI